jgi:Lhr-like helicase
MDQIAQHHHSLRLQLRRQIEQRIERAQITIAG